jgi:rare lipoprotein A
MRRRQGRGSRAGTMLVLVGIVGVLGATFVAGVWTGRHWPLLTGQAAPADAAAGRRAPGERPRPAEPLPALTFYQELTAPLTAPPPPPRPARPARPSEPRREPEKVEVAPRADGAPADGTHAPAPSAVVSSAAPAGSFTVQVGAYNARGPAEALRATLAAAGHDARVMEAETTAGMRYRVQVGTFPSREAARDTATRLSAERSLPAFVTRR